MIASVAGFASPPSALGVFSRASSQLNMLDLVALEEVAVSSGQDAIKIKVNACDNNECVMVDGWKDKKTGRWSFAEPTDASDSWRQSSNYSYKILMMEIDDIE